MSRSPGQSGCRCTSYYWGDKRWPRGCYRLQPVDVVLSLSPIDRRVALFLPSVVAKLWIPIYSLVTNSRRHINDLRTLDELHPIPDKLILTLITGSTSSHLRQTPYELWQPEKNLFFPQQWKNHTSFHPFDLPSATSYHLWRNIVLSVYHSSHSCGIILILLVKPNLVPRPSSIPSDVHASPQPQPVVASSFGSIIS